eukprot:scaffold1310_cov219-Ochromonas_danica.AAC.1
MRLLNLKISTFYPPKHHFCESDGPVSKSYSTVTLGDPVRRCMTMGEENAIHQNLLGKIPPPPR